MKTKPLFIYNDVWLAIESSPLLNKFNTLTIISVTKTEISGRAKRSTTIIRSSVKAPDNALIIIFLRLEEGGSGDYSGAVDIHKNVSLPLPAIRLRRR